MKYPDYTITPARGKPVEINNANPGRLCKVLKELRLTHNEVLRLTVRTGP